MKARTALAMNLALAAAASSPAAFAQNVTIYGIFDAAVERLDHVGASNANLYRMTTLSGTVPSRLGLRGTEDLGGGLKAVFTLEMGFGPDTGALNQGGRTWGRQAFVGLSGDWGAVTLGRQYTMLFWSNGDADVLGPNAYGISSLDNYFPNARADNSIAYRGTFSGLQVGAMFSVGRDGVNAGPSPSGTNCPGETTDRKACREYSAMLKYDSPRWGAALSTDSIYGNTGAFAGLTTSALTDTRTMLNGYLRFGDAKVGAGYLMRRNEGSATTPKSKLMYLGVFYPVTQQVSVEAELFQLKFDSSPNKAVLAAFRANYAFSKRTTVYTTMGRIDNSGSLAISASGSQAGGTPIAGGEQLGIATGIRHSF